MRKPRKHFKPDEALRHPDHKRPVTRRDFLGQGFAAGMGVTVGSSLFSLMGLDRKAQAAVPLSGDIDGMLASCVTVAGADRKIPFICFDLAGGANIAGSNVLIGQEGGQQDFLGTGGYERQGLPGDMIPGLVDPVTQQDYANFDLGLGFHLDSAFRRGILAEIRRHGPEETIRTVEAYHRLHPEAGKKAAANKA